MNYYGRYADAWDDEPVGGGAYNEDDWGSEVENFKIVDGYCHGFVQIRSATHGFNLERIGPTRGEDTIDDVLVVLVATDPLRRGQYVVGWYEHATCLDSAEGRLEVDDDGYGAYNFYAKSRDCVLLPPAQRTIRVTKGRGGLGQANVGYLRDAKGKRLSKPTLHRVVRKVLDYEGPNVMRKRHPPRADLAPYRVADESPRTATPEPFARDPDELDRALRSHARLQNAAARFLVENGLDARHCRPGDPEVDLVWEQGGRLNVAEVKSLNRHNETHQLRLALGQVLQYQYELAATRRKAPSSVGAFVVLPRKPSSSAWLEICERVGVQVVWPKTFRGLLRR